MANTRERDVVVVGAGIVGLACAWRAAQAGLSVLVVERDEPGGAASAAAAGMLAPVTEAVFGEQELLRLNMAGRAEWPGFAAELSERSGLDIDYAETGALFVAADRDDVGELRRLNELQRSLGLDARWVTGRDCRRLEPGLSPRVGGGVLAPNEAAVDPRAVVRALVAVLDQEGDDGGARIRRDRHRRRRPPAARGGLGGPPRHRGAGAGGGERRAAAGHARQPAGDRSRRAGGPRVGDGTSPQRRAARADHRDDGHPHAGGELRGRGGEPRMKVRLNGEPCEVREDASVLDVVAASGAES